jgi:5-methylcytosine-specific restriction protein A
MHWDKTPRKRGSVGQRLRKLCLERFPLCVRCKAKGINRPATQRDHVIPLFKGGKDDASNEQGLCTVCHEQKSAEDLGFQIKPQIGVDGWPVE